MNKLLSTGIVVAFNAFCFGCGSDVVQTTEDTSHVVSSPLVNEDIQQETNFRKYELNSMIMVDLDGDGDMEYVRFNRETGKVLIDLGNDTTDSKMTFETEDGEQVNDFTWADSWGVISDKSVTVTYAVDGELRDSTFTLENPAIKLWQDGGGSGFFTFKGGKWIWRTTGC